MDDEEEGSHGKSGSDVMHEDEEEGIRLHSFSEQSEEAMLHFQIIRFSSQQLYIWVGCNSAKFGNLYASMPTPFEKAPSLTALIGGDAESTGASIARRLALKTGWSIFMACSLPRNSPKLEANAERRLLQELRMLGYVNTDMKRQN